MFPMSKYCFCILLMIRSCLLAHGYAWRTLELVSDFPDLQKFRQLIDYFPGVVHF